MKMDNQEQGSKRTRWLTQGLMISGALNVALLITFVYLLVAEDSPQSKGAGPTNVTTVAPVEESPALLEAIQEYRKCSFEQLVAELDKAEHIEEGLARRDVALGVMLSQYHFNLPAALGGDPISYRQLVFQDKINNRAGELVIVSGLTEHQFRKIAYYTRTERWPYTSEGLFLMLKQNRNQPQADNSLTEAFYMTPEFSTVVALFNETPATADKAALLSIVLDGDWQTLSQFSQKQRVALNVSPQQRQKFLLDYTMQSSEKAAQLLLQEDFGFVSKKLDDQQAMYVVGLLEHRSETSERFAVDLLTSPRTDAVWKAAAARLYAYAGETMPEPYDHHAALQRFVSKETLDTKVVASPASHTSSKKAPVKEVAARQKQTPANPNEYVIQRGDNLWKIARRFHTDVKTIKKINSLQSDRLDIGQKIKLPTETTSSQ